MESVLGRGALRMFLHMQQVFLGIGLAVYAVFWAMGQSADLRPILVYSFCLGNLSTPIMLQLMGWFGEWRSAWRWLLYLGALIVVIPFSVSSTLAIVFWLLAHPGRLGIANMQTSLTYWQYLHSGWKFPSLVVLIASIVLELYRETKDRLEKRNQELQQVVRTEVAQREMQEQELLRAREIQRSLLPREMPQIEGFEIAGEWEPARVVGGDYFDAIKLGDKKLAICIADVVGKSVSAALLMANVQATVRAFASADTSPSWLCSRVNSVLCSNIATGKFVTLFYGILDAERNTFQYANAGHPRPLLVRASGAVTQLENGGAVLGVFPDWSYEDAVVQLAPGDRVLLFTDGITEAARADGEEFGEDRMVSAARACADDRVPALKARLLSDVKNFCNSHLEDDATLIIIGAEAVRQAVAQAGHS